MSYLSDVKSIFLTCPNATVAADTRYQLGSDDDYYSELPEVYWLRALYVSYTGSGQLLKLGRVDFVTQASGAIPSDSDSDWIMSAGFGHYLVGFSGQSIIVPDDCYIKVERGDTPVASGYSPTGIWAVSGADIAVPNLQLTMVYT